MSQPTSPELLEELETDQAFTPTTRELITSLRAYAARLEALKDRGAAAVLETYALVASLREQVAKLKRIASNHSPAHN